MLYSRPSPDVVPFCFLRCVRHDAGDATVLRREAAVPRRARVLSHGGLLRDVLRGRADRGARARAHAHVAIEGRQRRRDSHVRRARSTRPTDTSPASCARAFAWPSSSRSKTRRKAKGLVRREVVRVVSPGTLTDAGYLEAREPAFLMALAAPGADRVGVALLDLSTGEFTAAEYTGAEGRDGAGATSCRSCGRAKCWRPPATKPRASWPRRRSWTCGSRRRRRGPSITTSARKTLLAQLRAQSLQGFGLDGRDAAVDGGGRARAIPSRHAESRARARARHQLSAAAPTACSSTRLR